MKGKIIVPVCDIMETCSVRARVYPTCGSYRVETYHFYMAHHQYDKM